MAKLRMVERYGLDKSEFGLPDERKYPLIDEEHVRKAIQFFKYCPPSKRTTLANNINKKAKKLGMKLRISKDSEFYKYADKSIVLEMASLYTKDEDAFKVYSMEDIMKLEDNLFASGKFTLENFKMIDNLYLDFIQYLIYEELGKKYYFETVLLALSVVLGYRDLLLIKRDNKLVDKLTEVLKTINSNIPLLSKLCKRYAYELNLNIDGEKDYCKSKTVDQLIKIEIYTNSKNYYLINYLRNKKNELESELNIILTDIDLKDEYEQTTMFFLKGVNFDIKMYLSEINSIIDETFVKKYKKNYSLLLNEQDILFFSSLKSKIEKIYPCRSIRGNTVYFGIKEDKLYLLGKSKDKFLMFKLVDGEYKYNINNMISNSLYSFNNDEKIKVITITLPSKEDDVSLDYLTEGITFDKEGNIKFSFKPRKSYMDEYAETHKILVHNFNTGNIEGVKNNLAFLFSLINEIERKYIHTNKKVNEEKKQDAIKARMFAMNDFKTYLKKVQKIEPSFDFTKYYENTDYGKLVLKLSKDEIMGIKKLFLSILMS